MTTEPNAQDTADAPLAGEPAVLGATPVPTGATCTNCGTPLLGEHCYLCGQPVKGLVRRFSSVLGDIADTLFEIDTRLTRTIAPLLLRPGFLSCEYFAGRRVRYVSPVRLFFFISVVAFFVAQWTLDSSGAGMLQVNDNGINDATTVAAVEQQRDIALHGLETGIAQSKGVPSLDKELVAAQVNVRRESTVRIAELRAAQAAGKPPPVHQTQLTFGGSNKPFDPVTNPIRFASLPAFANRWLNQMAERAQGNLARIQNDQRLLFDACLSAVPSTLFLLMPLFAVLLKIAYVFKRRLYMEHFIVGLHSHAFLCFALLLVLICHGLAAVTPSPWLHEPLVWLQIMLIAWMPLYLLLMQKRVYGQGWIMTLLKFMALGLVYLVMLSVAAGITMVIKIIWL